MFHEKKGLEVFLTGLDKFLRFSRKERTKKKRRTDSDLLCDPIPTDLQKTKFRKNGDRKRRNKKKKKNTMNVALCKKVSWCENVN